MSEETVTITLTVKQAQRLRRSITRSNSYVHPESSMGILLSKLNSVGVSKPEFARCCECGEKKYSMTSLHQHLWVDHRYPEEDAGSESGRAWEQR